MAVEKKEETITISKSNLYLGIIGVLVILFIASLYTGGFGFKTGPTIVGNTPPSNNPSPAPNPSPNPAPIGDDANPSGSASISIPSYVPFTGSDSAKVNVIEFGDYQCPFCERFFKEAEKQIREDYVTPGKAKFYFMDFSFLGPDSETLAQGAWCANEQNKYYEYHNYVYSNQGQEQSGWGTPDKVKALVANIPGINSVAFGSCLDSGKYQSRVEELTTLGKNSGVRGTPTTFIGNDLEGYTPIVGAQPYSTVKPVIEGYLN